MKGLIIMLLATGVSANTLAEDIKDTWNLADIYPSVEAWYEARDALEARLPEVDRCKGQLGSSAQRLLIESRVSGSPFPRTRWRPANARRRQLSASANSR